MVQYKQRRPGSKYINDYGDVGMLIVSKTDPVFNYDEIQYIWLICDIDNSTIYFLAFDFTSARIHNITW